ncbi:hypothetical protein KTT_09590 [Tengunoibacter tsumagoiensis]|uniref:Uncharacterized protein n=1 Tax=Tengunoibacter tsumagoiensis TaxID=2014871 RepID=A0A401ZWE8_9CHLR|nr:hypothetical protein KTT_09590 [Tengunoibacter tsumagoiensis]
MQETCRMYVLNRASSEATKTSTGAQLSLVIERTGETGKCLAASKGKRIAMDRTRE